MLVAKSAGQAREKTCSQHVVFLAESFQALFEQWNEQGVRSSTSPHVCAAVAGSCPRELARKVVTARNRRSIQERLPCGGFGAGAGLGFTG